MLQTFLQIMLSNAVVAAVPAGLAWGLARSRRWGRPAVMHALWLLALLKLVTPPLVPVELRVLRGAGVEVRAMDAAVVPVHSTESGSAGDVGVEVPAKPQAAVVVRTALRVDWEVMVGAIWVAGAGVMLALTMVRLSRFNCLLREARCATQSTRAMAQQVAARLGVGRCPGVVMVPGAVSPMLWAVGSGARLVLPEVLWGRLSAAQRAALLAHELAHYRRRDHWVRYLELVVSVVYWWHPLVWLSRRELRAAEEACCDAWVLHALPEHARDYATALVDTVDFMSQEPCATPSAASGLGAFTDLKRRLVMIMNTSNPRSMSSLGRVVVLGLGLIVLPAVPRLATADDGGNAAKPNQERRDGDGGARVEGEAARRDGDGSAPPGDPPREVRPAGADPNDPYSTLEERMKLRRAQQIYGRAVGERERREADPAVPAGADVRPTGSGTFVRMERGAMLLSDDANDKDVRIAIRDGGKVILDGQPSSFRELRPGMAVTVTTTGTEKDGGTVVEAKRPRWLKTLMPPGRNEVEGGRTDDRQADDARRRADDERRRAEDARRRYDEAMRRALGEGDRAREVRPGGDPNDPNLTIEERMKIRRKQQIWDQDHEGRGGAK